MSRLRTVCRDGFTLSQLVLVLGLLVILVGLLLGAIQQARAADKRTQDANNLKQICLASINCADTNGGKMPPLVGSYPAKAGIPNTGDGTVFFSILPYVEQGNLYNQALIVEGVPTYRGDIVQDKVIKVYVSPADPAGGKEPVHDGWLSKSNYAANFQVFGDPRTNSLAGQARYPASITDGTANTIFFAQRYQLCGGDPCAWGYSSGTAWAPAFAYLSKGKFQVRPVAERCDSSLAQGLHPEGIEVGMGDGSVRLVGTNVSPQTWWSACTPAGGEVLGADW
jgi:type II secretory pathway pseudopilin PulG